MCTNFRGFNFCGDPCPRKLVPNKNFCVYGIVPVCVPRAYIVTVVSIAVGLVCIAFFLISLPFVLGNGVYLFQLFDQFAGTLPLLFCGFFEVVCVAWVYGTKRYIVSLLYFLLFRILLLINSYSPILNLFRADTYQK